MRRNAHEKGRQSALLTAYGLPTALVLSGEMHIRAT
jgi:hypothetical protein